jgi:hypothetical protein
VTPGTIIAYAAPLILAALGVLVLWRVRVEGGFVGTPPTPFETMMREWSRAVVAMNAAVGEALLPAARAARAALDGFRDVLENTIVEHKVGGNAVRVSLGDSLGLSDDEMLYGCSFVEPHPDRPGLYRPDPRLRGQAGVTLDAELRRLDEAVSELRRALSDAFAPLLAALERLGRRLAR